MKNLIILISLAAIFSSCEKTVDLDLRQSESKIVIEGQVTNHAGYQYVRVTRTAGFYDNGATPRVNNADVKVVDDLGGEFLFTHNPGGENDSIGYYLPQQPFIGEVGRSYTLTVQVDGTVYTATGEHVGGTTVPTARVEITPSSTVPARPDTAT